MGYENYNAIVNWIALKTNESERELEKIRKIMDETEDDENIAALITVEEAEYVLKNTNTSNPFSSAKDALFGVGDFVSNFAGNVYESTRLSRIIHEFGGLGVKATEYVGKNGNVYIRPSGCEGFS